MLSLPFLPVLSGWALARDVQMVMRASLRLLSTTFVILLLGVGMPAQQNPPAQPPGAQPPAGQPPPAQPPAGQPPAAEPPAGQPPANPQQPAGQRPPVFRGGINFVSVDVIVTDKKTNDVVLDLKQGRLRGSRGPEAAACRYVRARQDRSGGRSRDPAQGDSQPGRRGARGQAAERAAVRDLPRRLPRAARQRSVCAASRCSISSKTISGRRTWWRSCIR